MSEDENEKVFKNACNIVKPKEEVDYGVITIYKYPYMLYSHQE